MNHITSYKYVMQKIQYRSKKLQVSSHMQYQHDMNALAVNQQLLCFRIQNLAEPRFLSYLGLQTRHSFKIRIKRQVDILGRQKRYFKFNL